MLNLQHADRSDVIEAALITMMGGRETHAAWLARHEGASIRAIARQFGVNHVTLTRRLEVVDARIEQFMGELDIVERGARAVNSGL